MAEGRGVTVYRRKRVSTSPDPKPSPATERRERTYAALELRKAGFEWREIVARGGWRSEKEVREAVARVIKQNEALAVDEYRAMQHERLNTMRKGIWPFVVKGDLFAIDRALKIEEREAKLFGLDAPNKTEITGEGGGPLTVDMFSAAREREERAKEKMAGVLGSHDPYAELGQMQTAVERQDVYEVPEEYDGTL